MKSTNAALAILDAAYLADRDDDAWLDGIAHAAAPVLDRGLGVAAYFLEVGGPGSISAYGFTEGSFVDAARRWEYLLSTVGPAFLRDVHMAGTFATSDTPHLIARHPRGAEAMGALATFEAGGAAGVMGLDAEGRGVTLSSWAPRGRSAAARAGEAEFWGRVAAHLATAARVRRRLREPHAQPDAVLQPGGRLLHAEAPAQSPAMQAALRDATVALDRLRASGGASDPVDALSLWRCMHERRWTLVDQFERDGRRYVVAYPNVPRARDVLGALSSRERMAACAAAMGHSNKVIAYELGLAESTVATLLSRASRKLGVSSRVQLVRVMRDAPVVPAAGEP